MLYKQTAPPRHDVCLEKRTFKCEMGDNCSNILFIQEQNSKFKFPSTLMEDFFLLLSC